MANKKNVIRQDVVQISFDSNTKELAKIQKSVDDVKKSFTGGIGDDALEDLKKNAEKAKEGLEGVEKSSDKARKKLADLGKTAGGAAYNGLKKVAGISFKAVTVGLAGATTAVGALVKKSVDAYASYEQLVGGVETLFGTQGAKSIEEYAELVGKSVKDVEKEYKTLKESEQTVLTNADKAYMTAGMSANDYMETVTGFSASLLQSLKGDTGKAAEVSNKALIDMSDNANKMGTDMELIKNAYGGFAKGNYMMLDNLKLGYGGTKTEMERLLEDASKLAGTKFNIESYADVIEAIHVIQEDMGIAGTTAKEATKTISGSLGAMKASWQNTLTALIRGDNLDDCVNQLVDSVSTFGKNIMPAIEKALGGVGTLIERLAPTLEEKIPVVIETLLPPLIKAGTALLKAFIVALPGIVTTIAGEIPDILKQLGSAIGEAFGDIPILNSLGSFISENSETIKKFIPVVLGLVGAFMAFSKIKSVGSALSGLFGSKGGGKGEKKGGIFGFLADLAKMKTTTVLKGMANLAIILGGFVALTAVLLLIAPLVTQLGGMLPFIQLVAMIGILGVVGVALAKFGEIAGKISVATVALGLANMAIMIAGMSALYLLVGAVSLIDFDLAKILAITGILGALGLVGLALTAFAGIAGLIPIPVVLLGLANIAIVVAGMSALLLLIHAVSKLNFNFGKITMIIGIIGLLGSVGSALAIFAGVIGLVPIPIVLAGLTNMGLVLGGITALILAYGKLSEIKGFNEFLDKGGETLAKIFKIIGEVAGSLIGGLAEGISNSLPAIGENIGKFGENIKPLFESIKGVDMGGVGAFFSSLVGLLGIATGKDIVDGIKSFFGGKDEESALAKLGTELCDFATNSKGFFTTVQEIKPEAFTNAKSMFESLAKIKDLPKVGKDGTTKLAAIATDLSTFSSKTGGFFTSVEEIDLDKVNALWESLKGIDGITADSLIKVNEEIDKLVKKVSELPTKMGEGLKSAGESLSTALVEVWKEAVKASVAPVNKLLDGANHVLKEFGSKKKVISWEPYARGTDGHRGGNALVNDGRGAELIQMPNGRMFIPNGRNVFMPNAPRGMKVLSAERTASLMGKSSPTFHYAGGIGDIWSFIDNPSGLVSKIKEGISYKGMSGFASSLGKGMVSTFSGEMSSWIEKLFEEGVMGLGDYNASKGVSQWKSTVAQALKMEGLYSASNVLRTLFQMQTESGGNPHAINLWDSNAKKGTPSKGLMQVIDPTFRAYARSGYNKNIYDPLSNILASIRYATSRYGSLARAYRGVGYSNGVGTVSMPNESVNLRYTPESDSRFFSTSSVENNTYAPSFNLTISGSNDDRILARKVKRWITEAMNDTFESFDRKNPRTVEV